MIQSTILVQRLQKLLLQLPPPLSALSSNNSSVLSQWRTRSNEWISYSTTNGRIFPQKMIYHRHRTIITGSCHHEWRKRISICICTRHAHVCTKRNALVEDMKDSQGSIFCNWRLKSCAWFVSTILSIYNIIMLEEETELLGISFHIICQCHRKLFEWMYG